MLLTNADCVPVVPKINADAPETFPMTCSPFIRSELSELGPSKPVNVRVGTVGSALDDDSYTARILTPSQVSKDTSLS